MTTAKCPKRDLFLCTRCGIRVAGIVRNGVVYPYDRSPTSDAPARQFTCNNCIETR